MGFVFYFVVPTILNENLHNNLGQFPSLVLKQNVTWWNGKPYWTHWQIFPQILKQTWPPRAVKISPSLLVDAVGRVYIVHSTYVCTFYLVSKPQVCCCKHTMSSIINVAIAITINKLSKGNNINWGNHFLIMLLQTRLTIHPSTNERNGVYEMRMVCVHYWRHLCYFLATTLLQLNKHMQTNHFY